MLPIGAQSKKFPTRQIGTSVNDYGHATAVDSKGNVYVAGWTEGDLGNENNTGYTQDGFGIFLIKYTPTGERKYIKQLGDKEHDWVYDMAIDRNDNIYLTGTTMGSLPGNKQAGEMSQFGGAGDAFLIKFDTNGKTLWIRQWGRPGKFDQSGVCKDGYDAGWGVTVDAKNNVYVAGITGGNSDLAFESDGFLAKFDGAGKKLWQQEIKTSERTEAYGVTVDGKGDIVLSGRTWGSFDGNANAGKYDTLVMKYSAEGKKIFAKQFGSAHRDVGYAVAVDKADNIYVTGFTESDFGGATLAGGNQDAYLTKLTATGDHVWTKFVGGKADETAWDVGVDAKGFIYIAGKSAAHLENVKSWTQVDQPSDCFLAKFNPAGEQVSLQTWGSDGPDEAFRLSLDGKGSVYVTGAVWGALEGGTHMGRNDVFIKQMQ